MKKGTLLTVGFLMLALIAAGCGSSGADNKSAGEPKSVSIASAEETGAEEAAGETAEESEKEPAAAEEPEEAGAEAKDQASETAEVSETKESSAPITMKDIAGVYHLTGMVMDGYETATSDFAVLEESGMEMLLVLNEDGTGTLNIGEEEKIEWDEETITANGEALPYTYDPALQRITVAQDEEEMSFTIMTAAELIEAGLGTEGDGSQFADLFDGTDENAADTVDFEMAGADWVEISETEDGRTRGLCVWYDLTNESEDYMSMYFVSVKATQDGKELEEGLVYPVDDLDGEEFRYASIRPGVTCRAVHLLNADPEGGVIEYKVSAGYLDDEYIFETELKPKKLPGAPKEANKIKKIEKIDWLDDLAEGGVCNEEYEITIKDAEVRKGNEDDGDYLRVRFDFTNNSEESAAFFNACTYRAVQDGITLQTGWSSYDDKALDAVYDEVAPGKTAEVCVEWAVRGTSPVAVEIYDWWTEEVLYGKVFDVK